MEAVAVVGLVQNIITIGELCLKLIRQVRTYQNLPESLQDIQAKLPLILDSLRKIEQRLNEQTCSNETKKVYEPMLKRCYDLVQKLYDVLPKYETPKDTRLGRRVLNAISTISNETGIKEIATSIHQYIETFSFAQTTDLWGLSSAVGLGQSKEWLVQIPHNRDGSFVGREEAMSQLRAFIESRRDCALSGLGGVGKSQIAIEYCWRVHEDKPTGHIFWATASTARSLISGYREIAEGLDLASSKDPDGDVLQRVHRWLKDESNLPWLFVLDNADDLETFFPTPSSSADGEGFATEYLPFGLLGTVIIITRDARVASRTVAPQFHIQVPPLSSGEAQELLRRHITVSDGSLDEVSSQLVQELDCLPIAIMQAAVYINENNTTAAEYLENFLANALERQDLLSRGFGGNRRNAEMRDSLMWTWKLSYDVICEKYPTAAKISAILGVMSCDHVPIKVLQKKNGESWATLVDAVGTLQSFSFLAQTSQSGYVQIHRLFHLCIQKWLEMNDMTDHWRQEALALLAEHHPGPSGDHQLGKVLDPHVHLILQAANDFRDQAQYVDLLRKAGNFDRTKGYFELADEKLQKARTILEDSWGSDHVLTLATYNELGMIACELSEFSEAEEYHSKAEAGFKKLHGSDHPDYLHVLVNIGNVHKEKGHPQKAEEHFRQALEVYEKTHGHDHHLTLKCGCHVAISLYDQNKFADAEAVLRRVLVRQERLLGNEHPHTLESNQVLALTLVGQRSQYEEAEQLQRAVLSVYERTHGMHHIATWDSLDNLGTILRFQGKLEEALTLYLNIFNEVHKTLGPEHSTTLRFQTHIADVFYEKGDFLNAETHFRQVLDVYASYDTEHLETLFATNNVAASLRGQGRLQEAEEMQRDVLERWENGFGADDDKTLRCLLSLSETLARQTKIEEAMETNRKVHHTLLQTRPPDDPMVKECQDKYEELLEGKDEVTTDTNEIIQELDKLDLILTEGGQL